MRVATLPDETKSRGQRPKARSRSSSSKGEHEGARSRTKENDPEEAIHRLHPSAQQQPPHSTTHYAPSGAVPGPHFDDPEGRQGFRSVSAGPPAADFCTASPCGGRPYGGPAGPLTFGLFRPWTKFLESQPTHLGLSLDNRVMDPKSAPPVFFTERTLAAYLAVSDRTIRNWIRRGELPSYKLGASRRIDPIDVDAFLAERREEAAA